MRIIRIVSDGVPIDVLDESYKTIEEATLEIVELLKSDKIVAIALVPGPGN